MHDSGHNCKRSRRTIKERREREREKDLEFFQQKTSRGDSATDTLSLAVSPRSPSPARLTSSWCLLRVRLQFAEFASDTKPGGRSSSVPASKNHLSPARFSFSASLSLPLSSWCKTRTYAPFIPHTIYVRYKLIESHDYVNCPLISVNWRIPFLRFTPAGVYRGRRRVRSLLINSAPLFRLFILTFSLSIADRARTCA